MVKKESSDEVLSLRKFDRTRRCFSEIENELGEIEILRMKGLLRMMTEHSVWRSHV